MAQRSASPSEGTLHKITDELGITEPETSGEQALQGSPADRGASDARLREEVCEHLWRGAHVDVSEVSVQVNDGTVMLEGSVPNREMKYAIEDIVASCHGVRDIENRIRVMSAD